MWNSLRVRIGLLTLASLAAITLSSALVSLGDWSSLGFVGWAKPSVLFVLALIGVLVLALSYLAVQQFIAPLRVLTEITKRMGQGNYHAAEKSIGGVIEIEQLRVTLDQMAKQVLADQDAQTYYIDRLTNAQEDERLRVARDLHDHTIQSLAAVSHYVEDLEESLEPTEPVVARVNKIRAVLSDLIDSLRQYASDLRPPYLEEMGLVVALQQLAQDAVADFQVSGDQQRLGIDRELGLFRIVQEALRNAVKHAQATTVKLNISFSPTQVIVLVQDDGVGFDVPSDRAAYARTKHFGLMGMQEHAHLLHGNVQIVSERAKGTKVFIRVPLESEHV